VRLYLSQYHFAFFRVFDDAPYTAPTHRQSGLSGIAENKKADANVCFLVKNEGIF
jgi:hypothetical protein